VKAIARTHRGVVKVFPMASPWHYVVIPKRKYVGFGAIRVFGMMPIIATVGNTTWKTALLPLGKYGGESQFFIAIKAKVRKQESIREGDTITISFVPDTVWVRRERVR
jgi:hypothetical protein